ncbi:MAG: family 16 glycosylhydrolase, partial [Clostridia bacterium]|nr:family 16 glycosylhydrolase [Clostridia bacterium]
ENGILHILSKRIKSDTDSADFGEGKITLKKNLWYKYGCLEVRAKMPLYPAHCAIWLNGGAEIDIVENFSNQISFKSNIHKWFSRYLWDGTRDDGHLSIEGNATYDAARNYKIDVEKFGNLADGFHTYSLDWTEDYYRFAVDGKTYFRYDYSENEDEVDFFRRELYLILVCGCGSNSYGARYVPSVHDKLDSNGNYVPFDFQIDYVRLYQNPSTDGVNYDRTQ